MNFHSQKGFGVAVVIVVIAILGLGGWYVATNDNPPADPEAMMEEGNKDGAMMEDDGAMMKKEDNSLVACTADAKICPDGSAVGRVGPDCQFAPCPSETMKKPDELSVTCPGVMQMCPDGSFVSYDPDSNSCEYLPCPKIYQGQILAGSASPLIDFNQVDYEAALKTDKLVVLYFYANWCPTCKAEQPHLMGAFDALNTNEAVGFRVNYKDNQTDDNEETLAREFGVAYQHTKVFIRNGERVGKFPDTWDKARYLKEINSALN